MTPQMRSADFWNHLMRFFCVGGSGDLFCSGDFGRVSYHDRRLWLCYRDKSPGGMDGRIGSHTVVIGFENGGMADMLVLGAWPGR